MRSIKVSIDEDFCDAVGYCEKICPKVFRVNVDRRKAEILMETVTDNDIIEQIELAETSCPMRAIVIVSDD